MTNALITVKGYQYINGEEDVIELTAQGKFTINNGKYYIRYSESDESGTQTDTLIKADGNQVLLQKSGGTDSRMIIEEGKQFTCVYKSSGAGLILDIQGKKIDNRLSLFGGTLTLEYSIFSSNTLLSQNKTEITVKEV